jgi:alanine racemase
LGVATTNEGVALRESGIRLPVLVFLGSDKDVERMTRYGLIPLVYSEAMLDTVIREAHRLNRRIEVHIEVDSGMHRTGLDLEQTISALRRVRNEPLVAVSGIMTHLGCADMPTEDDFTGQQLALFEKLTSEADGLGFRNVTIHAAATAAAIRFPEARYGMVRIGIGLYGLHPTEATKGECELTPGISLVSQIIETNSIQAGGRVGYGGTFKVEGSPRRLAVVPAGYFDAVPRAFGRYGSVTVNGQACPVVGNVSMDSMTIDISACPSADVGSDVLIYGQHSGASVAIEDVADAMGVIPHELLVSPGPRVQRVFTRH